MYKKIVFTAIVLVFGICNICFAQKTTFHTAQVSSPAPGTMFIYPERIPLKDGSFANVERGTIFVPLNRSDNNSAVIGVEIYRFKASEKAAPGTPPIFFLHGGPSFGGLERPLERRGTFEQRWQPLTDIADVIIVGQRGIGSSKPTTTIEVRTKPYPPDKPYDNDKAIADFQEELKRERDFWIEAGLDLNGFTILEAAEDINDVRKAFGYQKITLWGGSFGSHWSMALMRMHPEIIERAILRGMEGPDHTYDHPGNLWKVYERVAKEVEAEESFQELIPEGGLINALKTVIDRVEKNPFMVSVRDIRARRQQDVLFDGQSIRRFARGFSGGLRNWAADVITMYNGDFERPAKQLLAQSKGGRGFRTASYFMLDCGSGITPERLAEYDADPAMNILGSMNFGYTAGCSVWGSDLGNDFRKNFDTNIPTVIAHGTWDTSTPYENATELVPHFKNSKFIPIVRGPHGAIRAAMDVSTEFTKGIYHFAATGNMSQLPDEVTIPKPDWRVPDKK